jgi:hypothetical protein
MKIISLIFLASLLISKALAIESESEIHPISCDQGGKYYIEKCEERFDYEIKCCRMPSPYNPTESSEEI